MKRFSLLFLLSLLFLAACGGQAASNGGPNHAKVRLALDFIPNSSHAGIFDALARGFYRQQGIDLQIIPWSPKTFPDTLVSSGQAEFGISTTDSLVPDAATGHPLVSLATIYQHNPSCVVVLADSGITSRPTKSKVESRNVE